MKKLILFCSLLTAVSFFCSCNNTQTEEIEDEIASQTMSPLWWYAPDEDAFYDVDTVDSNMQITVNLPAANQTFFQSKEHIINIWSHYEGEEIPEMSNFVASGYDDVDIWFVNQDNWTNLARGDSAISGDFIITLYYGNDTVKVHGREISI